MVAQIGITDILPPQAMIDSSLFLGWCCLSGICLHFSSLSISASVPIHQCTSLGAIVPLWTDAHHEHNCAESSYRTGNPADELVRLINNNRTAHKLPELFNSPGLGCMALQYISECTGNCSKNNTLTCQPREEDVTEIFAPNCGVELPTLDNISDHMVRCDWQRLSPLKAFDILFPGPKTLLKLHSKKYTEVGVGFQRVRHGPALWGILFGSGLTNSTFILEGGKGIEQKSGCFSGLNVVCSASETLLFNEVFSTVCFPVILYLVHVFL